VLVATEELMIQVVCEQAAAVAALMLLAQSLLTVKAAQVVMVYQFLW
jgi:hypothetical protein